MGDNDKMMIPYIVYEGELARSERMLKRMIIVLALTIVLFFVSNILWLRVWTSYDYAVEDSSETVTVDGGTKGIANYVGADGSIVNGTSNSKTDSETGESYAEIGE